MVSTRNSAKKETFRDEDTTPPPEEEDDAPEEVVATKKTPRSNRKKKQKAVLKSKNTGVGLSISIGESAKSQGNKKIVFDEDNLPEIEADDIDTEDANDQTQSTGPTKPDTEDDDDDDAIEEVKGSAAREEIIEQLKSEEKLSLKTKKKRKRKERKVEKVEEEDEDLDDDFFAELEAVRAEEAAERAAIKAKKPKGKHTTFVFQESEQGQADESAPQKKSHGIQVVVLPEEGTVADSAITAIPAEELSETAILFSRGGLLDGADRGKKRKNKTAPKRADTSWKRSRKVGLLAGGRFRPRGGHGRPAANFVTSKR